MLLTHSSRNQKADKLKFDCLVSIGSKEWIFENPVTSEEMQKYPEIINYAPIP